MLFTFLVGLIAALAVEGQLQELRLLASQLPE